MARITIQNHCVQIELSTLDKVWAIHGSLDIPLVHVVKARVEDENGWAHLWRKVMGTNAPGLKMAGTFLVDGGLAFLDYSSGNGCIVLETRHETYRTIIVQPDPDQDPNAIVSEINNRLSATAVS